MAIHVEFISTSSSESTTYYHATSGSAFVARITKQMSAPSAGTKSSSVAKIRRKRTGCKICRRRGKRCDEVRPTCRACQRLSLSCSYGDDFSFRNTSSHQFQGSVTGREPVCSPQPNSNTTVYYDASKSASAACLSGSYSGSCINAASNSKVPVTMGLGHSPEAIYFKHFDTHVQYLLPTPFKKFKSLVANSPCLRNGILCLAASNLSMLDARVQQRYRPTNVKKSVSSPIANPWHHSRAQKHHDLALWNFDVAQKGKIRDDKAEFLVAKILLAYYHHSSTDHLRFRLAVWETFHFVLRNKVELMNSPNGRAALQLWHRLCMSHRPSKPPTMLLEGEGPSAFGPNLTLPDASDHLYLTCILGMDSDDLIYDILIRTVEIRTRMVVFRCTAGTHNVSEQSKDLGGLVYELQNQMLRRPGNLEEHAEARAAFVQGSHLRALLEIQRERLGIWESRLRPDQLPRSDFGKHTPHDQPERNQSAVVSRFRTHRDTMNALYHHLCNVIFEGELQSYSPCQSPWPDVPNQVKSASTGSIVQNMLSTIDSMDFALSSTSDIYTLSLAEVLLQLVLAWQSIPIFNHVLDTIWPRLERGMRGYEHSHYPTHLVKRIIALLAEEWREGRGIFFALLAVAEGTSKLTLLDLDNPVDVVLFGRHRGGGFFVERKAIP